MTDSRPTRDHVERRREVFAPYVDTKSRVLEIGPSFMPTFPKHEGWNTLVLDTGTTEELRAIFSSDPNADAAGILEMEEVDLIDRGAGLTATAGSHGPFDSIVACHVIEHVPDLVRFLREASNILSDGGSLLLAVPSRELSFDFFRPLSTPGDVVMAHIDPAAFTARAIVDDSSIRAELDGGVAWLPWQLEVALREGELPRVIDREEGSLRRFRGSGPIEAPAPETWTGHRWVFEPGTFRFLIEFTVDGFDIPLVVENVQPGLGSEFLAVIRKIRSEANRAPRSLDTAGRQAYAARQAVLGPEDPSNRENDTLAKQLLHHKNLSGRLQERLDDLTGRKLVRLAARISRLLQR